MDFYYGTIDNIADAAVADLKSFDLGYQCTYKSSSNPSSLPSGQRVICVRRGIIVGGDVDYHFMRKNGSNWDHKPGLTNIIRFNETSPGAITWIKEGITGYNNVYISDNYPYNSNMRYIIISNNHNITTGSDGVEYCLRCGMVVPEGK